VVSLTVTRQSKHTPIPQNRPRGSPVRRVLRQLDLPAEINAPAIVWPASTSIGSPSKVIENRSGI
jgi:hypothetical protein